WGVSADLAIPITTGMLGAVTGPTLNVPGLPSLAGTAFYDQPLLLEPAANLLGVVAGPVTRTTLGSNVGAPGAIVYVTGPLSSTSRTGGVEPEYVTPIRLN